MRVYVRCHCGEVLAIDPDRDRGQALCPKCGRHCAGALPSDGTSPPQSRLYWTPPVWALVCLLVLCAALLWALAAPGEGSGGQGDGNGSSIAGNDPYAGRRVRGVGDGSEGEGSGGGTGGAGLGTADAGEGAGSGTDTGAADAGEGSGDEAAPDTADAEDDSDSVPEAETVEAEEESDGDTGEDGGEGDEEAAATPPPPVHPPMDLTTIAGLEEEDPPPEPEVEETPPVATGNRTGSSGAAGAGAPYEKRGDQSYARKMGATVESEKAVDLGLAWLARVQCDDGHWCEGASDTMSAERRALASNGGNDAGYTGLAVLAFLGAGHTHKSKGPYSENVRKALEWLLRLQKKDGSCMSSGNFYEQGIAATALCEAYGMTKDPALKNPRRWAIFFILKTMPPHGGFGYSGEGDDVHVTSFQVMAMKSARLAGLKLAPAFSLRLIGYYDRALGSDFTTGYGSGRGGGRPTSARTALGLFCRLFLDCGQKDQKVQKIAELLDRVGPQIGDVFQTYYGTYSMFQMGGDYWKTWNEKFRDPTIDLQIKEGTDRGAWRGGASRMTCRMVVETALRIMSLEVYYRYLPINK